MDASDRRLWALSCIRIRNTGSVMYLLSYAKRAPAVLLPAKARNRNMSNLNPVQFREPTLKESVLRGSLITDCWFLAGRCGALCHGPTGMPSHVDLRKLRQNRRQLAPRYEGFDIKLICPCSDVNEPRTSRFVSRNGACNTSRVWAIEAFAT